MQLFSYGGFSFHQEKYNITSFVELIDYVEQSWYFQSTLIEDILYAQWIDEQVQIILLLRAAVLKYTKIRFKQISDLVLSHLKKTKYKKLYIGPSKNEDEDMSEDDKLFRLDRCMLGKENNRQIIERLRKKFHHIIDVSQLKYIIMHVNKRNIFQINIDKLCKDIVEYYKNIPTEKSQIYKHKKYYMNKWKYVFINKK